MLGGEIEIAISASEVIRERHRDQCSMEHGTLVSMDTVNTDFWSEGEEPSKHQQVYSAGHDADARTSATSLQHLSCSSIISIVFLTYETNSSFMCASESCTAIFWKQIHIYDQRAPSLQHIPILKDFLRKFQGAHLISILRPSQWSRNDLNDNWVHHIQWFRSIKHWRRYPASNTPV